MADDLEMRRTDDPDQVCAKIEQNVGEQVQYEITALIGRSPVAGHVWDFMNAVTANLIQIHLCQREPKVDVVSFGSNQ